MQYTVKDFINLGYPFEKWMPEAVRIANAPGNSEDISTVAARVKQLPQFRSHNMRDTACPVYVNLDDQGEDLDFLIKNKAEVVESMTKLAYLPTVEKVAIMPDACTAGVISVGGVVASREAIHPAFHSADVCCSMFLTELDNANPKEVLDLAMSVTHFGPTRREDQVPLPEGLRELILSNRYTQDLLPVAERDFATQGDGNHFLFVGQKSSTGKVCVVTHHGSRGFGARLFKRGMKIAQEFARSIAPRGIDKQCAWIPTVTEEGQTYWEALQIVREWTYHNHMSIHDMIVSAGGHEITDRFWNEHNFVFERDGLYFHAKGATPGWLDTYSRSLVPLNMAEPILITRGTEVDNGIGFLPHGAGRNMSRTTFKKRFPNPTLPDGIDVRSFSGKLDITELPQAYKSAAEVKQQMLDYGLAEVLDEVVPYGSIMAGEIEQRWRVKKQAKKD